MNAVLRRLRSQPLSLVVAGAILVAGLLSAFPFAHRVLGPEYVGLDPSALGERRWWALGTSMLLAGSAVQFGIAIAVSLVGLGWAERRLGWRRTLVALVGTGVLASLVGVGLEAAGAALGEFWSSSAAHVDALDPLTPLAGAIAWASMVAGPPWGRRVRVTLIATAAALLLYSGQPADLYLLLAVGLGVAGGAITRRRMPGETVLRAPASRHESRTLLALATVIFAVGPLLTLLSATRYGVLSPLGIALGGLSPVGTPHHAVHVVSCVAGHVAPGCVGELTRLRLHGIGPTLVSLLPLALMLVAARGLVAGRRMAVWVLVLFLVAESLVAGLYFGVLPLSGSRWFAALRPERYAELSLWLVVSTLVPLVFAVVLLLRSRMFPVLPGRRLLLGYAAALVAGFAVPALLFVVGALTVPRAFRPFATPPRVLDELLDRFVPVSFLRHEAPDLHPVTPFGHLLYNGVGPVFWIVVVVATLVALVGRRGATVEATEAARIRGLLQRGSGSLGFMATWAGNRLWTTADGRAGVAYRVVAGHAVTLSDPFGDADAGAETVTGFLAHCDANAWTPVFYSVHEPWRAELARRGWRSLPVAEEAVLDPAAFTTAGKKMQDVRTSVNRAAREGLIARWGAWSDLPLRLSAQIDALSEEWMAQKDLPELGFTLGGVDELRDDAVRIGLALDADQRVLAITSWLPVWTDGTITGWTLDVMRRSPGSPNGVMEFLLADAVERFREEGVHEVSLSGSPLASEADRSSPLLGAVLAMVGRVLEPLYGFRSLLRFKRKFGPVERTMYLCYADPVDLPGIGLAVAGCYLPGFRLSQLPAVLRRR